MARARAVGLAWRIIKSYYAPRGEGLATVFLGYACYARHVSRLLTLLLLALTLCGCHLIFRYEDEPVHPDGPAIKDRGADAAAPGDLENTGDLPPGDLGAPDSGGYYINEPFTSGAGVVKTKSCSWSVADGLLHQISTLKNGCHALADVPVNDYAAETYVQVHAIQGISNWSEGAGLGVRVQKNNYQPPVPPAMYVCAVSPDTNQLVLARCPGGAMNDCIIMDQRSVTIDLGTPYRIRVVPKGLVLDCSLPDLGKSIAYPILDMAGGGVALVTFYARASFDYLRVKP